MEESRNQYVIIIFHLCCALPQPDEWAHIRCLAGNSKGKRYLQRPSNYEDNTIRCAAYAGTRVICLRENWWSAHSIESASSVSSFWISWRQCVELRRQKCAGAVLWNISVKISMMIWMPWITIWLGLLMRKRKAPNQHAWQEISRMCALENHQQNAAF